MWRRKKTFHTSSSLCNSMLPSISEVGPETCQLKSYRQASEDEIEAFSIPIKSRFGADVRRISMHLTALRLPTYKEFEDFIFALHEIGDEQRKNISIAYVSSDQSHLPLNNDDNLRKAVVDNTKLFRVIVQNRAESLEERFGYGTPPNVLRKKSHRDISKPLDFRRVSAILDADILPPDLIRVELQKYNNDKPLGFFIRDGVAVRLSEYGPYTLPSIFISRLLPDGLAASTNLLHVNDEILEVNGISMSGRTLDQATDIMIANAKHLVLTVKPMRFDFESQHLMQPPVPFAPPAYHLSTFSPAPCRENISPVSYGCFVNRGSPMMFYAKQPEITRLSHNFQRASLNTASSSSAESNPPSVSKLSPADLPQHLPPPHYLRTPPNGVPVRRIPRPFSTHSDGLQAGSRSTALHLNRFSTAYEHY